MPLPRFVGTLHPVGVELPRPEAADPDMPDVSCAVMGGIQINDPSGGRVRGPVVQLQLYPGRSPAEESKVDSLLHLGSPEWQRGAPTHVRTFMDLRHKVRQRALVRFAVHRCHRMNAASSGTATPARFAIMRGVKSVAG